MAALWYEMDSVSMVNRVRQQRVAPIHRTAERNCLEIREAYLLRALIYENRPKQAPVYLSVLLNRRG